MSSCRAYINAASADLASMSLDDLELESLAKAARDFPGVLAKVA